MLSLHSAFVVAGLEFTDANTRSSAKLIWPVFLENYSLSRGRICKKCTSDRTIKIR